LREDESRASENINKKKQLERLRKNSRRQLKLNSLDALVRRKKIHAVPSST